MAETGLPMSMPLAAQFPLEARRTSS